MIDCESGPCFLERALQFARCYKTNTEQEND